MLLSSYLKYKLKYFRSKNETFNAKKTGFPHFLFSFYSHKVQYTKKIAYKLF